MPLQRARTMPASQKGRTSRMASTASRAKASRSAGAAAKRQKAAVKKSSTEAYKAATRAVMDLKEEKYFHVQPDQQQAPAVPTAGGKRCSVLSFATTDNNDPQGNIMTYCGNNILPLSMLRPYNSTSQPADQPNMLDGKECIPSSSLIGWQINRNYTDATDFQFTQPNSSSVDPRLVENLPVRCRVIRVTPKLAAGVTTQIDPDTDLFLDQSGKGYSALGTDFTYSDAEYAQVNSRVYTVISDQKFTLNAPLNATWIGNAPSPSHWAQQPSYPGGTHTKRMVTSHQLAQKKGGAVHFNQPDSSTTLTATSGSRREYIFMHFWYECPDHGSQPALIGPGIVPDADVVKVHFRPESRFKDA